MAIVMLFTALAAGAPAEASLTRNPAGAKNIGEAGGLTLDTAGEFERDSDGRTWTFGPGLQYQAADRLQILAETVLYQRVRPDEGEAASGFGDTDLTLSWLAAAEHGARPSAVLGARVKLPTAGDAIGTGEADYAALLVLGKESGELEVALELEYGIFGSPPGEQLDNQFLYTLTGEYGLTGFMAVYAELFGHSAPSAAESRTDAGLIGVELDVQASPWAAPYVSLELDTEGATTARAGVEWNW
ncbi:MAG: transporter [Candidatus Eisenbacteria bacterium]